MRSAPGRASGTAARTAGNEGRGIWHESGRHAMRWFTEWRRRRILRHAALDESLWRRTLSGHAFLRRLARAEKQRLREQVILFMHEKSIQGAGGLSMHDDVRVEIAAQACILILNLDLDYYRGWVEVIVYPNQFIVEREYVDEASCTGCASRWRESLGSTGR
jgi:Mlc titration factor MtfA (ptsG expression regulator)